ncbi:MAG: nucleoside-diphosphate sugar epimerase/dehydratase, partial [Candidatus Binatia bacterium]
MTTRHYSPRSVTIVVTELAWILVSLAAVIGLDLSWQRAGVRADRLAAQLALAGVLYLAGFYYADAYNFSEPQMRREVVTKALRAGSALAVVFGLIFLCTQWLKFHSTTLLAHLVLTTTFVIVLRTHIDGVLSRYGVLTRIAIVGTGPEARGLAEQMLRKRQYGHEVTCLVATDEGPRSIEFHTPNPGVRTIPVIDAGSLLRFVRGHHVKRILVATADLGAALPVDELLR